MFKLLNAIARFERETRFMDPAYVDKLAKKHCRTNTSSPEVVR